MGLLFIILFIVGVIIIFYAMVGYPVFLKILQIVIKPRPIEKNNEFEPKVSYMIVAHNEENVIREKLENAIQLDYPNEKLQIIVASDNSTDKTSDIVKEFIECNKQFNIMLYCSKEHMGKTNAQNEAQKQCSGEILVMTDANTILKRNAIREIVSSFSDDKIVYVCGKLEYSNAGSNITSESESTYWNLDLFMRDIESRICTITAGNGALYAVRNSEYLDVKPIYCHDSIMPFVYGKKGKRAVFNPDAVAYEKAGETNEDEYKRKVRMNRDILDMLNWGISVLNPFRYGWFAIFYFGHRTCRYSIWLAHLMVFIASIAFAIEDSYFGLFLVVLQILFFVCSYFASRGKVVNNRLISLGCYYGMTVLAQFNGVINIMTGKAKPVWDKATTTR